MLVPHWQHPFTLPEQTVALTYDDGPGLHTLELARFLINNDIRATFFVVGKHLKIYPEVVREVSQMGHLIGNHTYAHIELTSSENYPDFLVQDVLAAHYAIEDATGIAPCYFRAPFGKWSPAVAEILTRCDLLAQYIGPVSWDIQHGDWAIGTGRSPTEQTSPYTLEECQTNYLNDIRKKGKGIVLLHDSAANDEPRGSYLRANNRTLELTKWLVCQLKEDTRFARLDDLVTQTS